VSDEILDFVTRAFAADVVECNGQLLLFLPRPACPPIFVGGAPPHALRRAVRFGDAWMPMGADAKTLAPAIGELRAMAEAARRATPAVVPISFLQDRDALVREMEGLAELGVEHVVYSRRYTEVEEFAEMAEIVMEVARGV
jgi:alkanesulfonate monooxygenase SsuD/methylene tetrahydromethanopterin reductase-like flavin-dependent oxidoreductase (luciferase family)